MIWCTSEKTPKRNNWKPCWKLEGSAESLGKQEKHSQSLHQHTHIWAKVSILHTVNWALIKIHCRFLHSSIFLSGSPHTSAELQPQHRSHSVFQYHRHSYLGSFPVYTGWWRSWVSHPNLLRFSAIFESGHDYINCCNSWCGDPPHPSEKASYVLCLAPSHYTSPIICPQAGD